MTTQAVKFHEIWAVKGLILYEPTPASNWYN